MLGCVQSNKDRDINNLAIQLNMLICNPAGRCNSSGTVLDFCCSV